MLYAALAVVTTAIVVASGVMKLRREPMVVKSIHELVGVPLRYLPWLAACEFAGGTGLIAGIFWRPLGLAAATGLVLYFIGAIVGHVRVGDFKVGPAAFLLCLSAACLATRWLAP